MQLGSMSLLLYMELTLSLHCWSQQHLEPGCTAYIPVRLASFAPLRCLRPELEAERIIFSLEY